uniref:Uncharacterized protein n=1 Tax=Strombidium inclinatum TaxID=197538 RepID=A0A7S3IM52_9SPIT|mmetsp:Transcript_28091/g.42486  ORF Transcript_28091/g.42486 Transcript_28091/m.42486 type:complete len:183 (+) Transcript_28091:498-1046(+)
MVPDEEEAESSDDEETPVPQPPQKRGRGRPRKDQSNVYQAPSRPRGRPSRGTRSSSNAEAVNSLNQYGYSTRPSRAERAKKRNLRRGASSSDEEEEEKTPSEDNSQELRDDRIAEQFEDDVEMSDKEIIRVDTSSEVSYKGDAPDQEEEVDDDDEVSQISDDEEVVKKTRGGSRLRRMEDSN